LISPLKIVILALVAACFMACSLKSKEVLHMERQLEFLDNTREVNQLLGDSIFVEKCGFLRNKKEGKRYLILKVRTTPSDNYFVHRQLAAHVRFVLGDTITTENWQLTPIFFKYNQDRYLLQEFKTKAKRELRHVHLFIKSNHAALSNSIDIEPIIINND